MENPINILIEEHRLIQRMMIVIRNHIVEMKNSEDINLQFIDVITDFFETFIDRHHHHKEEDIYFKKLTEKDLPENLKEIMDQLTNEHELARELIGKIVTSKDKFISGDISGYKETINNMDQYIDLYEHHVYTENNIFFVETIKLFSTSEQEEISSKFNEFSPHEMLKNFTAIVENLEKNT